MDRPDAELYLSDARGIYLPRDFARIVRRELVSGVTDEDWAVLESGPDHEHYWDTWDSVLGCASLTVGGVTYTFDQDGDLFAVPEGMEWNETEGWVWPSEEG